VFCLHQSCSLRLFIRTVPVISSFKLFPSSLHRATNRAICPAIHSPRNSSPLFRHSCYMDPAVLYICILLSGQHYLCSIHISSFRCLCSKPDAAAESEPQQRLSSSSDTILVNLQRHRTRDETLPCCCCYCCNYHSKNIKSAVKSLFLKLKCNEQILLRPVFMVFMILTVNLFSHKLKLIRGRRHVEAMTDEITNGVNMNSCVKQPTMTLLCH